MVCKDSKEITQSWQDKFGELSVLLSGYDLALLSGQPLNNNVIEVECEKKGLGLTYRVNVIFGLCPMCMRF